MSNQSSFQPNPTKPYITTNPYLNNPAKGVSLDVMGSACAQQLLLKSFSGGRKNRKTKNRKTKNRKTKNRKTKNRNTKNRNTKNSKTKNRNTKNRNTKKYIKKFKKINLKGGTTTSAPKCNVTGKHFVEDANKGAKIPPTGYALSTYGSGPDWGYKPIGANGQPTSFVDHHLQTMGTQGIAINQTKGLLSNYLLENENAGHCQEGKPEDQ